MIVVDASVADAGGLTADDAIVTIPRGRGGHMQVDAVAEAVAATPGTTVVLARPPWADPSAAAMGAVAMILDREVVWLPAGLAEAGWATALIARWAAESPLGDVVRRAQVAVGLAALPACRLPRRPWGCARMQMPALRPGALARWCDRLWSPCAHCATGGGVPGGACGRCGHEAVVA